MRRAIAALLSGVSCVVLTPAAAFEGRWEGVVRIPERELSFVADLARDPGGRWIGSITLPGLGLQGTPLSRIVVTDTEVSFTIAEALASETHGPATFSGRRVAGSDVAGDMRQAGNVAAFAMRRTGAAQVAAARRSTPVRAALEDEWVGEYELGGYPRRVTIALQNRGEGGATAQFVIVGKQTTRLPVDLVVEDGAFVRVESQQMRVSFEGRVDEVAGALVGVIELGALELALTLRRAAKRPS